MDSLKKMTANVFSKKPESEPATPEPSASASSTTSSLSSYKYVIVLVILSALAYYFREQVLSLYQVYVADSVRRLFGETLLKMHLTPAGEFATTYVPDLASLGKMVGVDSAPIAEVGLDDIGV
jgi:hypothetical protein